MKLTHIRDITAVAERGGLRAAARHLNIAQAAISRSIRELEQELGVSLIERRATGVVLTPFGERFVQRAAVVQNELRQAKDEIDQLKGVSTGSVSAALSTASHIALLPHALELFRARYPGVFLHITERLFPAVEQLLQSGALDFYVGPLAEAPPTRTFNVIKLFDNSRLVFGRNEHPLARSSSLSDLVNASWITTAVTQNGEAELAPLFASHGLPAPKVAMLAPSALTMIFSASSSDLLMMLPRQWLNHPATRALVTSFKLRETLPAAPICLVHRARLPLTPAAEYFADLLRRAALREASA